MIRAVLARFCDALLLAAGLLITISTVSLLLQVVSRYFFNAPTVWSEELAIFCFVWSTMLAVPVAFFRREHIVIDFAVNALPGALRTLVSLLTDVICVITLGVVGYFSVRLLAAAERQSLSGLSMLVDATVPLSALYLAIPVGCFASVALIIGRLVLRTDDAEPAGPVVTPETEV